MSSENVARSADCIARPTVSAGDPPPYRQTIEQKADDTTVPSASTSAASSLKNLVLISPDGGWGWVVVFASFVCQAIIEGLLCVFGLLLPHLLDHYESGRGKTALAGSLMAGMFLMSGPIAGAVVNLHGCRVCTIVGSILTSVGLIVSTLAPTINLFILSYGVITGIGLGLQLVPAIVIVGYYFERRRALATGIACSGAGAGMLIFAYFTQYLLTMYNWKEALLILAALSLHGTVMGCLMRPLQMHSVDIKIPDYEPARAAVQEKLLPDDSALPVITVDTLDAESDITSKHTPWFVTHNASLRLEMTEAGAMPCYTSCHELSAHKSKPRSISESNGETTMLYENPAKTMVNSCHELNCKTTDSPGPKRKPRYRTKSQVLKDLANPLNRQDIFYSGSIVNLPEYQSQGDLRSYIASTTNLPSTSQPDVEQPRYLIPRVKRALSSGKRSLISMFDTDLLTNQYFIILCLASVFIQLAYFIPYVFIIDYALQVEIDVELTATLVSVLGLSNGLGRVAAGSLGNIRRLNPLHVNNISLIVAGVTLILIGFLCKAFIPLLCAVTVFGYSVAAFVSLLTVFLVQYMGLDQLTSSLSLLNLAKGLASFVGPPLAGMILDESGSYEVVFSLAGIFFIIAAFLYYMLMCVSKCKNQDGHKLGIMSKHNENKY